MDYHELVAKMQSVFLGADAGNISEHIAYQIVVEGEAKGIFYIEISDRKVNVEPYTYYDKDVNIITSASVLIDIADKKLNFTKAYENGSLKVDGDYKKLAALDCFIDEPKISDIKDENPSNDDSDIPSISSSDNPDTTDTPSNDNADITDVSNVENTFDDSTISADVSEDNSSDSNVCDATSASDIADNSNATSTNTIKLGKHSNKKKKKK